MPETMLPLYLWDLRAQVEAQLRLLTDVQRALDAMPSAATVERERHTARIVKDIKDILEANAAIRDVTKSALEAAHALQDVARS